jgi:hypothetical protein
MRFPRSILEVCMRLGARSGPENIELRGRIRFMSHSFSCHFGSSVTTTFACYT